MQSRAITLNQSHLHFPVRIGDTCHALQIWCGNILVGEFYIALTDRQDRDYFFLDLECLLGKTVAIILPDSAGLPQNLLSGIMVGGDAVPGNPLYPDLYREALRPQFHFSSRRGWLNDPNGLVYANGVFHLYYQHNPLGVLNDSSPNMSWGHAVSADLVRWQEKSDAILRS